MNPSSRFGFSLLASLGLHLAALLAGGPSPAAPGAAPPPLAATLRAPPPPPAQPPLLLPAAPTAPARAEPPARPAPARPREARFGSLRGAAAQKAQTQIASRLLYPTEAVERGLEGEALVMLFLDASGDAIAARIERSSGHAILDEAALRAARAVRGLPDTAPREALLPVRFRLR